MSSFLFEYNKSHHTPDHHDHYQFLCYDNVENKFILSYGQSYMTQSVEFANNKLIILVGLKYWNYMRMQERTRTPQMF